MDIPIYQVDAFTNRPFGGNPAAVCLSATPLADRVMQAIAAEMNLSETAFLVPQVNGYALRWFTPTVEVDLCGHATLASAHVLWETARLDLNETARFHTRSGLLSARKIETGIELDFPTTPLTQTAAPAGLEDALGVTATYVGQSRFDYLLEVPHAAMVRQMTPEFAALARFPVRGIIVTSRSDDGRFDFISRFFAPASGIDEDPVTGSAHCVLGPYWAAQLGKPTLSAFQASPRGGELRVTMQNDRVLLTGQAVTVLQGTLLHTQLAE